MRARSRRPDARFAEIYAREQYGRRGESSALWLVPRSTIVEIAEFPDEFDLKYRRVDGYSIKARLREARERAGTSLATPLSDRMGDRIDLLLSLADDELQAPERCDALTRRSFRRAAMSGRERPHGPAPRRSPTTSCPRVAQLGVDRHRALPRGGRRVLLDRAERDRPCARPLRARGGELGTDCRRARVRPLARGVPQRAARRAAPPRVGAHDRPPLALRDRRRDPHRGAEALRRPRAVAGHRGEDRPGGAVPPHARRDVDRPAPQLERAGARARRGARRVLAVRPRRARRRATTRAASPRRGAPRPRAAVRSSPSPAAVHEAELAELLAR